MIVKYLLQPLERDKNYCGDSSLKYSEDDLNDIYDKTNGYCYYCGKKPSWKNYGVVGERGAWEVDHSNPKAQGGTDYFRNLVPSCISCNRSKQDLHSRQFEKYID